MKYDNQLRYASQIVERYDGRIPLSAWLKDYFRLNKQMGSNDRKTISEMVYGFYRLGFNQFASVEERLLSFISISENIPAMKEYFFESEKNAGVKDGNKISPEKIFSYNEHLSEGIDAVEFSRSFLTQPDLFLRARPSFKNVVIEKLAKNNTRYKDCGEDCIALPNSTRVESVIEIDKEAVIQDKSSQKTGRFIAEAASSLRADIWDCCAASGGKSIMAYDILNSPMLTVSDIRESILHNLNQRFERAGIGNYKAFIADLTDPQTNVQTLQFDLVIADVPCSGSGTWARTPEQLYFFKKERINYYSTLQQKIVSKVASSLKPGGMLLYITCSVFAEENERNVEFIERELGLKTVKVELIKGYNEKADTLFAALFTNQ